MDLRKSFLFFFLAVFLGSSGIALGQNNLPGQQKTIFMYIGIVGDTNAHIVWENITSPVITNVTVEKSLDGINFTALASAATRGLADIHALFYPTDMEYNNVILYSTESGTGRYIYNNKLDPGDPDIIYYRVVMLGADGMYYYTPAAPVSRTTGVSPFENIAPIDSNGGEGTPLPGNNQLKGGMKALCNPVGTPPSGYTPTGQSQTIVGTCCFYVNTQYSSSQIQIPCGGGSYAWCCTGLPGAQNCPSLHVWDPCCVHYCYSYNSCSCHPWSCCQSSQTSVWVVTQSVNYPGITLSAVIVNETCTGLHDGSVAVTVTNGSAPITYTWSGGQPGTSTISNLPAGSYTVTVTDAHNCTATASYIVSTSPPPIVTMSAIPAMCIDAPPLQLTGGSPAGGVYSGTGVNNGIFDPAVAGAGTFVITYTYTAPNTCIGTATTTITVNPLPVLSFASLGPYCQNVAPITLTQGTPSGGAYTGTGINNGVFYPAIAGPGSHVITYIYTDANLCTSSITQTITVNAMPVASVNPIPPICIDAPAFALNFGTPSGGTFAGSGVSNNIFDPAVAGAGITTVVYFYSDNNQCSDTAFQTITVNPLPIVTLAAFPDVCIDLPTFTLAGGSPVGGTYYVDGTQATLFNPATLGTGVHQILYVYSDANTCTDSATGTLTVNPLPVVTSVPMADVCVDLASFALTFGSPVGGVYTGTGVTGGNFDPATAGAGTHTLTYTYTDPVTGCVDFVTEDIVVNPLPIVTFGPIQTVCSYSPSFQLTSGSPAGGVYSGPGVSNGIFDPAVAGLGTHTLTYTYTDPVTGCVSFATQTETVNATLNMAVNPSYVSVCPGFSADIVASGALNYSWTPSAGLSSTTSAAVTATPQFTTTYTVYGTDIVGCTGSATGTVNVYPPVSLSIIAEPNEGCKPLTVHFSYNNSTNDSSIVWLFDDPFTTIDTSSQIAPVYTYTGIGSFNPSLTVVSYDGCVGSATTDVHAYRIPVADFYPRPELVDFSNPLVEFMNQSLSAVTWRWNFGDPGSGINDSSDIEFPVHTYIGEGIHEVQLIVTSGHNCADTTTRLVEVLPEIFVYVPNSISPNGDGINDTWKPVITNADQNAYVLYLYNRWGELVWETHDLNESWNGQHKGDLAKEDVYVWIIWYKDPRGEQYKLIGHVSVLP